MARKKSSSRKRKTDTTDISAPDPIEVKPVVKTKEPKKVESTPKIVVEASVEDTPLVGMLAPFNGLFAPNRTFFTNTYLNKWGYSGDDLMEIYTKLNNTYKTLRAQKNSGTEMETRVQLHKITELRKVLKVIGYSV